MFVSASPQAVINVLLIASAINFNLNSLVMLISFIYNFLALKSNREYLVQSYDLDVVLYSLKMSYARALLCLLS